MVIPQPDRGAMVALRAAGMTFAAIAKKLDYLRSTVSSFLAHYKETGSYAPSTKSGRPQSTTAAQDTVLEKIALKNRKDSAPELNKKWKTATRNRNLHQPTSGKGTSVADS